jgi:tetratricopeptide (TPR) repeat protein
LKAGRAVECEETCLQLLSSTPDNCDAMHLLALACQMNSGHRQAIDLLDRALELSPHHPEFLAGLGLVHARQGQFAKTISLLNESLNSKPDDIDLLYNMGLIHVQLGEYEQAVDIYGRAISLRPDIDAFHLNCGGALQMAGHLADAEECYREAIRIAPNATEAGFNLGTVLGRMQRYDEPLDVLEQVVSRSPGHHGALRSIGETRLGG